MHLANISQWGFYQILITISIFSYTKLVNFYFVRLFKIFNKNATKLLIRQFFRHLIFLCLFKQMLSAHHKVWICFATCIEIQPILRLHKILENNNFSHDYCKISWAFNFVCICTRLFFTWWCCLSGRGFQQTNIHCLTISWFPAI